MTDPTQEWPMEDAEEERISFYTEDVDFELGQPNSIATWLEKVVEAEGHQLHQLTYIFCSDDYLLELNQDYLDHNTYTDIITFPYTELPLLEGDIFISIDRVKDNARELGIAFEKELHRVMVHGVLHLCGYSDKTEQEALLMRKKEDEALSKI